MKLIKDGLGGYILIVGKDEKPAHYAVLSGNKILAAGITRPGETTIAGNLMVCTEDEALLAKRGAALMNVSEATAIDSLKAVGAEDAPESPGLL